MPLRDRLWIGLAVGCLLSQPLATAESADSTSSGERLEFAVVLTRHGVRSPTWTNERLNEYAKSAWPIWGVAPGMLTPHGRDLMVSFGKYYREYFASQGLLITSGCSGAGLAHMLVDTDKRTVETGQALAEGIFAGCPVTVESAGEGHKDALFHSTGKVGMPNGELALSAVAGRIGADPAALLPAFDLQIEQMQRVLFDCTSDKCAVPGRTSIVDLPPSLKAGERDHLVTISGPLFTAATMAENFQLEYLEGMPASQIGWGRVDEKVMRSMMALHSASSDLIQRTPYIARVQGSNLLGHIQTTIEQAELHKPVPGAIGTPDDKIVFLVGHDTNITNVAALLGAHWLIKGYQRDDAAPGGALVFELWHEDGKEDSLRTYYIVQTPDQMRNALPTSLQATPGKAVVFIPGCSSSGEGAPCSVHAFFDVIKRAIDPAFVR